MTDQRDVQIIKPPNTLLKAKVEDGTGISDVEAIKRAEEAIVDFGMQFSTWAVQDIEECETALKGAQQDPEQQKLHLARIFKTAIDLKGQGGSFGYMLITEIGDSLKKFTEDRTVATVRDLEIIAAHVDAMRAVMAQDIRGDGGILGRQIVQGLKKLTLEA